MNMAPVDQVASSSSSSSSSTVYSTVEGHDVFLSFRGDDVRRTILSHLYSALCQKKIKTFKDDDKLQIGNNIPNGLFKAIEQSKLAIVIFSKNYVFSSWCLRELGHIIRCKKNTECVLPVFYEVDPSHVRKPEENYADAFAEHEKSGKHRGGEIDEWKRALSFAADISGGHFSQYSRSEAILVDQIVKGVLRKLNRLSPVSNDDLSNLVGMRKHIRKITQLLHDGSPEEKRIIGIWGIGGIGKTTLASVVFNRISTQFERRYFLLNVSEELKNQGLTTLQAKLFAALLEEDSVNIGTPFLLSDSGKERLQNTKVLVVLDDVSSLTQFDEMLLRSSVQLFGKGSIIIVTTKDLTVLKSIKASEHEVKELDEDDALKLFRSYALEKGSNTQEYEELSKRVVNYANRIPLALKVFGSYLYSTRKSEWNDELKRIRDQKLEDSLFNVSYEGLHDERKQIFLDIAAFFKGEDRCLVESVLDGCKLSAKTGIKDLINKSFITITRHDKLWMHNLVQQMGQEIVRKKWERLGKRCRLWKAEDICEVLATDSEGEAVRGIFLDMTEIEDRLQLSSAVFSKMRSLKFLKIYNSGNMKESKVFLSQGLESLPMSLVYFYWHGYPLNCLPPDFIPKNLVELGMPYSEVDKIWDKSQNLGNLKRIDLSYSKKLTQIPDLSSASNVESINLEHCTSLSQVSLHNNLHKLTSLNLTGCSSLENISELPKNITYLNIKNCSRLQSIPAEICELKSLCSLNLSGCLNLKEFPEISSPMECLIELILDRTAIKNLPSSINMLTTLKTLSVNMCENLEDLTDNISCLDYLQSLSIRCCPKLKLLPALPPSLANVDARDCMSLQSVSSSKAVTEGQDCSHHINAGTFIFYNCQKLDTEAQNSIMADARLRIMHIANVTSKYGRDPDMTEICWPGNEIPNWFEHQSKTSSKTFTLSSNKFGGTFLGFVFCVVVDFKDCNLHGDFKIYCEASCVFPDGFEMKWRHTWIWHWNHHRSDNERDESQKKENGIIENACRSVNCPHVFLFYDNGRQIHSNLHARKGTISSSSADDEKVSVTFKFYSIDSNGCDDSSNCQVKSCGIRLLYADDITNLGFLSQDDDESVAKDNKISIAADVDMIVQEDEEENEQHLRVNQPDLQMNESHPEKNDERKFTYCCLQFSSLVTEFCDRFTGKRSSGLHNGVSYDVRPETSRLTVTSSQSKVVQEWPPLKCEQVIRLLMEVQDQNKQILQHLQLLQVTNPPPGLIPGRVAQASN